MAALLLALLLGATSAFLVSCGSTSGLIGQSQASRLVTDLEAVSSAVADGDCDAAEEAGAAVSGDITTLSPSIDSRLRSRLRSGAKKLAGRIPTDCRATTTDTTPTDTETQTATTDTSTETTPTDTTPTDTETQTETVPQTTTLPQTSTVETTTTITPPTATSTSTAGGVPAQ